MADTTLPLLAFRQRLREEIREFLQQKHPDWKAAGSGEELEFQLPDNPDLKAGLHLMISLSFVWEEAPMLDEPEETP